MNKSTIDVKPIADKFMRLIYEEKFDSAQLLMENPEDLRNLFTGEGKFFSYKKSCIGVYSRSDVCLCYFLEGIPGENRNIDLSFIKKDEKWVIHELHVNYHIDRKHKAMALNLIDKMVIGDFNNVKRQTKDIDNKDLKEIYNFIYNENNGKSWKIAKATNITCTKNCFCFPNKIDFVFASDELSERIRVRTYDYKGDYWIGKVNIYK